MLPVVDLLKFQLRTIACSLKLQHSMRLAFMLLLIHMMLSMKSMLLVVKETVPHLAAGFPLIPSDKGLGSSTQDADVDQTGSPITNPPSLIPSGSTGSNLGTGAPSQGSDASAGSGETDSIVTQPALVPLLPRHKQTNSIAFLTLLATSSIGLHYHQWYGGFQEQGVDIDIPAGTPVASLSSGVIMGAGFYGGGGVITIRTDGLGDLYYQHLDGIDQAISLCNGNCTGQRVSAGTLLGSSGGDCGWHSWGNPCPAFSSGEHIEIGINPVWCGLWGPCPHPGSSQDPLPWIRSLGN